MRSVSNVRLSAVIVSWIFASQAGAVTAPTNQNPAVTYDHLNDGTYQSYSITVAPYQPFIIRILNTFPSSFTYEVAGIPISRPGAKATGGVTMSQLETKEVTQAHDPKYGGYVVRILPKDGAGPVVVSDAPAGKNQLSAATLVIAVTNAQWDASIAGAFTVSGLRDPVFALEPRTEDGKTVQYVVEDKSKEDRSRLGTGAFVNVYHTSRPWLGGTFGIGVNDNNRTTYFAGPSIRFGDKAAVTVGLAAGSITRLPAGVSLNKAASDNNVLNNLSNRVSYNWFIGFSFSFLSVQNALEKPFAGGETAKESASSANAPQGSGKPVSSEPDSGKPGQDDPLKKTPAPTPKPQP